MGKIHVLRIYPDLTFQIVKKKTTQDKVMMSKDDLIDFTIGKCVLQELTPRLKFWKPRRKMGVHLDGSNKLFHFDLANINGNQELTMQSTVWSREEAKAFVQKQVAKSKSEQKLLTGKLGIIIMLLLIVIVVLQFLNMRGFRFV